MDIEFAERTALFVGDILYIKLSKTRITPAEAAKILERNNCKSICFNTSKKIYHLDNLKGKENWKDVN